MKTIGPMFMTLLLLILMACSTNDENGSQQPPDNPNSTGLADITKVVVSGNSGNYNFQVTISSPDTGCDQYADWWEVVSENGLLVYRRVLLHSHVNEQPFTRSGGPVDLSPTTNVWVRAHMNNSGYGGKVFFGSASQGFSEEALDASFASDLEQQSPLPDGCAF